MTPARLLKTIDFFQRNQDEREQEIQELWIEFGKSIRATRKERGIEMAEFSHLMGVSRAMIGYLESGKRDWNLSMAGKAVKLLGENHAK